jgi:RNA polymerase sigma-70 factor, ECF subfamily
VKRPLTIHRILLTLEDGGKKRIPCARAAPFTSENRRKSPLSSRLELSNFLASIERRAYKHAFFSVRDEEAALDIVQDSMMRLAEKYGDRPAEELPMLFQRILQNAIRDHFRRQKVRSFWTAPLSTLFGKSDEEEHDPLESIEAPDDQAVPQNPASQFQQAEILALIEAEIQKLPARQREAFLLRYWEELDVAETATAMGCSEGSVKTHCSRATHSLAAALRAKGIDLQS